VIYTPLIWLPIEFQKEINDILEELYTPIPWKEIEHIPKPEGMPPERVLFRKYNDKSIL